MVLVGIVPYLNALPLVADLPSDVERLVDVPSRLAPRLVAGEIDAALLPVAEAIRGRGLCYLGRHGIVSDGPVASVLLFLRVPLARVRTVALDPASRTSAGLARHVVLGAAGPDVRFRAGARPGADPRTEVADAVLVIGDPALRYRDLPWPGEVVDLGLAWRERTGLPFVYARWTARPGLAADEREALATRLDAAARSGIARREALARAWATERGEDPEVAARYVRENVTYPIGPREEAGLARYAAALEAEDLRPTGVSRA